MSTTSPTPSWATEYGRTPEVGSSNIIMILCCLVLSVFGCVLVYGFLSGFHKKTCEGDSVFGKVRDNWWFWIIGLVPIPPFFPIILLLKLYYFSFC